MKNKTYINCYTISSNEKIVTLNPGIAPENFCDFPEQPTLRLPESLGCRFAVEEKFKELDSSFQNRWLVLDKNSNENYYRFFNREASEADGCVYILFNYNYPEEMSRFMLSKAVTIEPKKALIMLQRTDYNRTFVFKNKTICLTPYELYMY